MLKVENIDVFGWRAAIRGMRNPMNSWDKSDSSFIAGGEWYDILGSSGPASPNENDGDINLGYNDIDLMKRLIKGGSVERKFLRMIHIQMDIVAPLYWWKEFDTYKVATVANSCSTMHKIAAKEFTLDDFSHEHLLNGLDDTYPESNLFTAINVDGYECYYSPEGLLNMICEVLNHYRKVYLETKDKKYWWQMIQLLPSSYDQRRTVDFSYETALKIIKERSNHKLDEWHTFVDELMKLPYMEEFVRSLN